MIEVIYLFRGQIPLRRRVMVYIICETGIFEKTDHDCSAEFSWAVASPVDIVWTTFRSGVSTLFPPKFHYTSFVQDNARISHVRDIER